MEKRLYPRVARPLSAIIENSEGVRLDVVAVDTTCEGFCIQCNTMMRNQITPGGNFVRDGKPVELFVWLDLPTTKGKAEKIGVRCHVAFSRRLSSEQCKIGVRYLDLDKNGYDILIKYIESALLSTDAKDCTQNNSDHPQALKA